MKYPRHYSIESFSGLPTVAAAPRSEEATTLREQNLQAPTAIRSGVLSGVYPESRALSPADHWLREPAGYETAPDIGGPLDADEPKAAAVDHTEELLLDLGAPLEADFLPSEFVRIEPQLVIGKPLDADDPVLMFFK